LIRLVAVQRCPVVPNPPHSPPSIASSRFASSSTIIGFFPPSSNEQCLKLFAAVVPTVRPTAVDPVSEIARTSECSVNGPPTLDPNPLTTLITPLGTPASVSVRTRLKVERGVSCAGLMTHVFPQTSAGSSFQEGIAMGKFHGVIMPQTPKGCRTAIANLFGRSEAVVGPNRLRPSPAMEYAVSIASCVSRRVSLMSWPISRFLCCGYSCLL